MILYGAPGQAASTWGVSGPTFLRVYIAVSVVVLVGALVSRRHLFRGGASTSAGLSPHAAAYLNGGAKLAVYSSLGGLRTAGAIDVSAERDAAWRYDGRSEPRRRPGWSRRWRLMHRRAR